MIVLSDLFSHFTTAINNMQYSDSITILLKIAGLSIAVDTVYMLSNYYDKIYYPLMEKFIRFELIDVIFKNIEVNYEKEDISNHIIKALKIPNTVTTFTGRFIYWVVTFVLTSVVILGYILYLNPFIGGMTLIVFVLYFILYYYILMDTKNTSERRENEEKLLMSNIDDVLSNSISIICTKKIKDENISRILPPLPDGWKLGDPLRVGDKVVFTGCDPAIRDQLETDSKKVGVAISSSVSAKTRFLVTDGSYVGNKANEAKKLGTRIVSPEEYALLLKFIQPTIVVDSTKSKAKSSQSGAEDLDPAEVRAWAISKGIPVSPKGRIQADVYEAFRNREIRN